MRWTLTREDITKRLLRVVCQGYLGLVLSDIIDLKVKSRSGARCDNTVIDDATIWFPYMGSKMKVFFAELKPRERWFLYGLFLSGAAAVSSLLMLDQSDMETVYHRSGFYILLGSFFYGVFLFLPRMSSSAVLDALKAERVLILVFAVMVGSMFWVSPPEFRILADETNLLGIALSMFEQKDLSNTTQTLNYFHQLHDVEHKWGIRPNLFPFLIYLMHSTVGYSAYNGFLVNGIAGFVSLYAMYWLLRRWFETSVAFAGAVLLASYPVFVLWVTASGFEIVNLALALIAFCWFYQFTKLEDGLYLERLAITLLLLAQARYESAVFAISFLVVILFSLKPEHIRSLSYRALIIPWLFLPIAWQRLIKSDKSDYQVYDEAAAFSVEFVNKHITAAIEYFLAAESKYGTIGWVTWLALLGCGILLVQVLFRGRAVARETKLIALAAALSFVFLCVVVFSYYWGNLTAVWTIRLGIIFLPFFIVLACVPLQVMINGMSLWQIELRKIVILASFACLVFYWPVAAKNQAVSELVIFREYKSSLEFLHETYSNRDNLIISSRPGLYAVHRWGSVNFQYAERHRVRIHRELKRKLYQDVLVIQVLEYGSDKAIRGTALSKEFQLTPVYETQFNSTARLRISKLD